MKDTINRQDAIVALQDGALINYQAAGHHNGLVKAIDVIKGLPPAQPEIIHCRECKYQQKGKNEWVSWNLCIKNRPWHYMPIEDDDFCSKAERKQEGEQK